MDQPTSKGGAQPGRQPGRQPGAQPGTQWPDPPVTLYAAPFLPSIRTLIAKRFREKVSLFDEFSGIVDFP